MRTRQRRRVRFLAISLALHAAVLWQLATSREHPGEPSHALATPVHASLTVPSASTEAPIAIEMLASPGGGSPPPSAARATRAAHIGSTRARSTDPWAGLAVTTEQRGQGNGTGSGTGTGSGNGIGFGTGGGVEVARDVPAPPPPPRVSKARPAKLVWPNRDLDVEDESALFVARVTVDAEGSVVGARMLTLRPGSRADHAANAIWTFRYLPALDDDGRPVRSTFEQPFQVR